MLPTKSILFKFEDKFSKETLTMRMPYYPGMAKNGHYSQLYKRIKEAFKFGFSNIIGQKWTDNKISDRTVFSFNNGISIDMPFDVTEKDIKIIKHHLEGIKMALKD